MKRLTTAIIISFILIILCITGQLTVKTKIGNFKEKIDNIETLAIDNSEEVISVAQKCEKEFHQNESVLALFVNHEKLDELKRSLSKITAYSKLPDFNFLYSECAEANIIMKDILEDQQILIHTIF